MFCFVLPETVVDYLMRHVPVQEMTAEAGMTGDRELAIQALSSDPRVPNPDIAREMANDFFDESKSHLPQFHGKWTLDP